MADLRCSSVAEKDFAAGVATKAFDDFGVLVGPHDRHAIGALDRTARAVFEMARDFGSRLRFRMGLARVRVSSRVRHLFADRDFNCLFHKFDGVDD